MTQQPYGYGPQPGYQPGGFDPYTQQYPPSQPMYNPNAPQGYQPPAPQYGPPPGVPNTGYGQPQQPPVPQGAKGTLDDFYGQPSGPSGKGISWKQKPDGYRYVGVVRRTPTDSDVFQDSDPQTKQLKTWRDGTPKMVLPVPLTLAWLDQFQQMEYPDREAAVFLRGNMRDEVTRAMQEAGQSGVPQQGALTDITLTHRKPGNNIATNMYSVIYRPAGSWENDPAYGWVLSQLQGPATAPQPQQNQFQQQAPAQQYGGAPQGPYQQAPAQYAVPQANPNPQQYAVQGSMSPGAPQYGGPAYDPNNPMNQPYGIGAKGYDPVGDAVQGNGPLATPQQQAAVQQPQPQNGQAQGQQQLPFPQGGQAPQGAGQMPAANGPVPQAGVTPSQLDQNQQQLLARLTAGQQGQQAPQGQ